MKPNCLTQMQVLQAKTKGSLWVLFCCFDLSYLDSSGGDPRLWSPAGSLGLGGRQQCLGDPGGDPGIQVSHSWCIPEVREGQEGEVTHYA